MCRDGLGQQAQLVGSIRVSRQRRDAVVVFTGQSDKSDHLTTPGLNWAMFSVVVVMLGGVVEGSGEVDIGASILYGPQIIQGKEWTLPCARAGNSSVQTLELSWRRLLGISESHCPRAKEKENKYCTTRRTDGLKR